MGIEANFSMANVRKKIEDFERRVDEYNLDALHQVGLKYVTEARSKTRVEGSFSDQTGNLRSSIGYIVMKDGKIMGQNFQFSEKGTEKVTGFNRGMNYAKEIGLEYTKGYALIVVAGMEYAAYVENKGRDVITGSSINAKKRLRKYFG